MEQEENANHSEKNGNGKEIFLCDTLRKSVNAMLIKRGEFSWLLDDPFKKMTKQNDVNLVPSHQEHTKRKKSNAIYVTLENIEMVCYDVDICTHVGSFLYLILQRMKMYRYALREKSGQM
ncbi:CLUMA_CG001729, isoform A [Clunio marinus]|uniref:CLUMA_CG001729, isoform A n=1 Tax=Clunio marinus TaxID=568069 RepID=A0A1J1HIS7_9DIPT|nr:CLUMA_CG001729, isoform A [Clunio marinus]